MRLLSIITSVIFVSLISIINASISYAANLPKVEKITADKNISIWLVENHDLPILNVQVIFKGAGAALVPTGKEGVAEMATRLMSEGAGKMNAQAFQTELDVRAINLSFNAGQDNLITSLTTLTEHQNKAFELMSLALTKPKLSQDAFNRIKEQILVEQKILGTRGEYLASTKLLAKIFNNHPYGKNLRGTAASIKSMNVADVKNYISNNINLSQMKIVVVGDITPVKLKSLINKYLSKLPKGQVANFVPPVKLDSKAELVHYELSSPQTVVDFAFPAIKRNNKDFYAAYIMNHILGGSSMTSRLGKVIREDAGLSYYVYTGLLTYDAGGILKGSFGTRSDQVKQAISLLKIEISSIHKKGFSEKEFMAAKNYIVGNFPLNLTSNSSIIQYLSTMRLEHLGTDYLEKRNEYMSEVTLEDVNRVAKEILDPKKMIIVSVGEK